MEIAELMEHDGPAVWAATVGLRLVGEGIERIGDAIGKRSVSNAGKKIVSVVRGAGKALTYLGIGNKQRRLNK